MTAADGARILALPGDRIPVIDDDAWVAPGATIVGDVRLAPGASVWYGAVVRGDNTAIAIGRDSNLQDNVSAHVDPDFPLSDPKRISADLSVSALGRLLLAEQACATVPSPTRYTTQEGELTPGFGCLAVPVRAPDQRLVAGLALAVPAVRLADRDGLLTLVGDTAERLGPLLQRV